MEKKSEMEARRLQHNMMANMSNSNDRNSNNASLKRKQNEMDGPYSKEKTRRMESAIVASIPPDIGDMSFDAIFGEERLFTDHRKFSKPTRRDRLEKEPPVHGIGL